MQYSFAKGLIVIEPIIKIFTTGITQTWGKWLDSPSTAQSSADLMFMSEKIWENTLKPLSSSFNRDTPPRDWCLSATGENLRWEVVGLLLTLIALVCGSLAGTYNIPPMAIDPC